MNKLNDIFSSTKFFKIVICIGMFVAFFGLLRTDDETDSEIEEIGGSKRHSLVIYDVKDRPNGDRFQYEYYTDTQMIMTGEKYSVGDTISFTTRKVKRQVLEMKKENISLKAELSQRDENWKTIQANIVKILSQYN